MLSALYDFNEGELNSGRFVDERSLFCINRVWVLLCGQHANLWLIKLLVLFGLLFYFFRKPLGIMMYEKKSVHAHSICIFKFSQKWNYLTTLNGGGGVTEKRLLISQYAFECKKKERSIGAIMTGLKHREFAFFKCTSKKCYSSQQTNRKSA